MKQAREKELEAWIAADPARQKKYGDVLPALRALQAESEKTREQTPTMMTLTRSSTLPGRGRRPSTASRWSVPRRTWIGRRGFSSATGPGFATAQERMQRTMDATADRALLRWALGIAAALPADQRIGRGGSGCRPEAWNAEGRRR